MALRRAAEKGRLKAVRRYGGWCSTKQHVQGFLGALIALGGVVVVVADQLGQDIPLVPMLLAILGSLFIAQGGILVKANPPERPFAANGLAMLAGSLVRLALSFPAGEPWAIPSQPDTWVVLGCLVLLGSIALFGPYLYALQRWTASAMSYVTLLMPPPTAPILTAVRRSQRRPTTNTTARTCRRTPGTTIATTGSRDRPSDDP